MASIAQHFPQFGEEGKALVQRAYDIAAKVLENEVRDNGRPFIEHPMNVALIATDEIGLTADWAGSQRMSMPWLTD